MSVEEKDKTMVQPIRFLSGRAALLAPLVLPLLLSAGPALAQDGPPPVDSGSVAWMLTSSALVVLMTIPGLALFYSGMVRRENVLATIMQTFGIFCLVTVIWLIVGYSLAFGDGGPYVGDLSHLFGAGLLTNFKDGFVLGGSADGAFGVGIPAMVFFMFQLTFAAITPALITGAFADRVKFFPMMVFMALWSMLVYSPIAHWVWQPNGFLFNAGVLDFAGGTVVHINAGIAGLVACILIGKRHGYPREMHPPHNLVLTMIGAGLLWVGWFGFNAGSALEASGRAGAAMVATQVATAGAALAWLVVEGLVKGKGSVLGGASGAVAGLVAVTPACGFVSPGGALVIGLVAGAVCFCSCAYLKKAFGYDDSLDVWGVHGVGGIVGALLTGVFALSSIAGTDGPLGLLEGNAGQFWIQVEGVLYTLVYSGAVSAILIKVVDLIFGLRVDTETEIEGLDLALHGEVVP